MKQSGCKLNDLSEKAIGIYEGMNARASLSVYYMLGLFLVGLGYIAIVPVFEGFDETAHYSSLREIALNHTIPIYGESIIDRAIAEYKGPQSYGTGAPPFDQGYVYPKFFADDEAVDRYIEVYRSTPVSDEFSYSGMPNWQAQHPPLYYLLLAPVIKLTSNFSMYDQILTLRVLSYLLALIGVYFGMVGASAFFSNEGHAYMIGYAFYPILLPMFFLEFGRIGNDALCLLLSGLAYYVLALCVKNAFATRYLVILGVILGLGLLTKALFVPILAGTVIYIAGNILADKAFDRGLKKSLAAGSTVLVSAVLVGGGWYLYKSVATGAMSGSDEAIRLAASGGLVQGLSHHFDLAALLRGMSVWLPTYQWAGTWSLVRLPIYFQLPSLMLLLAVMLNALVCLRHRRFSNLLWMSVVIFALFIAGLIWHVFIAMALGGVPTSPGWYLHTILPWVAPALGIGLQRLFLKGRVTRLLTIGLLVITFVYQLISTWSLISLYSACAIKSPTKQVLFQGDWYCLSDLPQMIDRLSVIASPQLFVAAFVVGYAVYSLAIRKMAFQAD
ncbi:MAG: glycosyltransferase family 39 protein [Candidatus Thiodiazotropha sp.]